jgi:hypothetical protein
MPPVPNAKPQDERDSWAEAVVTSRKCSGQTGIISQTPSAFGVTTAWVDGIPQIWSGDESARYWAHGRAGSIWIIIRLHLVSPMEQQQEYHEARANLLCRELDNPS